MVITRSQTRANINRIIYRGFNIQNNNLVQYVDNFYNDLDNASKYISVLKNFWNKHKPEIEIPNISIEYREQLAINLINNKYLWDKFNKTIHEIVEPYEKILEQDDYQNKMSEGQTILNIKDCDGNNITINLNPLLEFNYWLRLVTCLLCNIQTEFLNNLEQSNSKIEKSKIAKRIFELNISYRPLITNKYAFSTLRFYVTQIKKLIEFFNQGLEISLFTFGIFCPEMVNDNCFPNINKNNNMYKNNELEIKEDDPIYGEVMKKLKKFY
jgi:hypothetical protein